MHLFNIATNLTRGPFVIGYEEDKENFYLSGRTENDQPVVSGRILSARGEVLVEFRDNNLVKVTPNTRLIKKTPTLLRIRDELSGLEHLSMTTREEAPGRQVTYISGEFYDKMGRLAARGDDRGLIVNCPLRL